MQHAMRIETPDIEKVKELLREKIWRKSHSLGCVTTFDKGVKRFEKYLSSENTDLNKAVTDPYTVLDNFASRLDKDGMAGNTTHTYIIAAKKYLRALGTKITDEDFRELVTLPKKRPPRDKKVSKEVAMRILLELKHLGLKLLLMIEKDTQARPGEILGLRMSDFDFTQTFPLLTIPSERAKNDIPRELFFSDETKTVLMDYIKRYSIGENDFLFIDGKTDQQDERNIQSQIHDLQESMTVTFRNLLKQPQFADINKKYWGKGKASRYEIRIYSFKKFAFTAMADVLGETAARAIKGDGEYALTYYKKSREERAEDFDKVISKLLIFTEKQDSVREQIQEEIKSLKKEELASLLEQIRSKKDVKE